MHYGQILQSHALHFFHLSSPDLLFGFESPVQQRNIVGVAGAYRRSPGRACCCASSARR
jgi:NAD-reducing hydrogenase large subunit